MERMGTDVAVGWRGYRLASRMAKSRRGFYSFLFVAASALQ